MTALCAIGAVGLAGCAGNAGGSASSDSTGVPVGTDKEAYIAAFEEVEPIELDFQLGYPSLDGNMNKKDIAWAESLTEWSGGKIQVNLHPLGSIAGVGEVPDALVDGRLDIAYYLSAYDPDEMAAYDNLVSATVEAPTTPLVGELVSHATMMDAAFNVPEILADFTNRDLHVIASSVTAGNLVALCTEPVESPEDWKGKRVRVSAGPHAEQVEGLGAVVTSIEGPEVYEALQRGVVDCTITNPATAIELGHVEVAPHIKVPQDQSFALSGNSLLAGAAWEQLPLVAQQLMFDLMVDYMNTELHYTVDSITELGEAAQAAGGNLTYIDDDSNEAFSAANEEILGSLASSERLDGEELHQYVGNAVEKWTDIATESGYTDDGGFPDFAEWYKGAETYEERDYFTSFSERMYEEIFVPNRPS